MSPIELFWTAKNNFLLEILHDDKCVIVCFYEPVCILSMVLPHIVERLDKFVKSGRKITFLVLFQREALPEAMFGRATAPRSSSASVLMNSSLSHLL